MNLIEPDLSVLMCVHNGAEFLQQAIDSLMKQTFRNFELIIVDDSSTDDTPELLSQAANTDERIKVHTLPENVGLTKALNIGLSLAKGRYVARIDHDDGCHPSWLQKQFDFMESNPDHMIIGCGLSNLKYGDSDFR